MEDLIIENCNVSKMCRDNPNKRVIEANYFQKSEEKRIRNVKARKIQKLKTVFGIAISVIFIICIAMVLRTLNEQSDKNIQDCLNAGFSNIVCLKMEGIY